MAGLMIAIANSISSNYVSGPAGPSYDPDAQAFFTAEAGAGVTLSDTEKTAINTLVVNLKAANIWSKMKALYPFIGSTATSQKFNLINPADTNAAFRLSFQGGWTHSSNGATPNGTNAYANTFLNPSTLTLNNTHNCIYIRTNVDELGYDVGASKTTDTVGYFMNTVRYLNNLYSDQYLTSTGRIIASNTDSKGNYISTRTASNVFKVFKNNSQLGSTNTGASGAISGITHPIYIGALNENNSPIYYSTKQCAFASIGDGLTDLESQVFNQIVEGYQFSLGRNINPNQSFYYNTAYNNETNAYLYSTQITDTTTQVATNTLVNDLKAAGVWTKMKAVYPMAGSTATTQKYNLVNSQDTNAAFRLSFVGGWTHSSLGATPNGTNAYGDTFINTSTNLSLNSGHLSFYSRTNSVDATIRIDIGSLKSTPNSYSDLALGSQNLSYFRFNNTTAYNSVSTTNTEGFYIGSRTASNIIKLFKNSSIIVNGTALSNATSLTNFYLGAANSNNSPIYYSNRQCAFASIGDGLTDTEAANFYTAVQNFQISLGRAIYLSPPTVSDSDAQAFINAATIVDQVEATAVNNLVIGLKADNLWTKMKAVYPLVGSSATSQKYNLKNPLDTNAAFRLVFNGGWTHSFNGITGNGTNTYADTYVLGGTNITGSNYGYGVYINTEADQNTQDVGVGANSHLIANFGGLTYFRGLELYIDGTYLNNSSKGFFHQYGKAGSGESSTGFINGTKRATLNGPGYLDAANVYVGGRTLYSSKRYCFGFVSDKLTDTEATNLYNRTQTFNTTLNRQV